LRKDEKVTQISVIILLHK